MRPEDQLPRGWIDPNHPTSLPRGWIDPQAPGVPPFFRATQPNVIDQATTMPKRPTVTHPALGDPLMASQRTQPFQGQAGNILDPNSVIGQMGTVGNQILSGFGFSPWGPQDPNAYQTQNARTINPTAVPQYQTILKQSEAESPFVNVTRPGGGFYSKAEQALQGMKQDVMPGDQFLKYLKAQGVKDEELKWTGLLDLANQPKVQKTEAINRFQSAPQMLEKVLGGENLQMLRDNITMAHQNLRQFYEAHPHMSDWAPEHYQESERLNQEILDAEHRWMDARNRQPEYQQYVLPGYRENDQEILMKLNRPLGSLEETFHPPHYGSEPNLVTHTRFNDRYLPAGEKATHMEEGQSDWYNTAKKYGIRGGPFEFPELTDAWKANYRDMNDMPPNWNPERPWMVFDREANQYHDFPTQREARQFEYGELETDPNAALRAAENRATIYPPNYWSEEPHTWEELHQRQFDRARNAAQGNQVPDAPFIRGGWSELNAKRALWKAATDPESQYLTWTTGEQQAKRWPTVPPEENMRKRQAYDVILRHHIENWSKQKATQINLGGHTEPQMVWSIKMTPELRAKILKTGFPLFSTLGAAYGLQRMTAPAPEPPPGQQQ
jgi:hypothetical protein